jgi:hypothetical protein
MLLAGMSFRFAMIVVKFNKPALLALSHVCSYAHLLRAHASSGGGITTRAVRHAGTL